MAAPDRRPDKTFLFDATISAKVRMSGVSRADAHERAEALLTAWLEQGVHELREVKLRPAVKTVRTLDDIPTSAKAS